MSMLLSKNIQEWRENVDFSVPPTDAGIITRLYSANIAMMKLTLQKADRSSKTISRYLKRLWRTCGLLQEWASYHSVSTGALDRSLQRCTEVRDNTIELLAGIAEILSKGMWSSFFGVLKTGRWSR